MAGAVLRRALPFAAVFGLAMFALWLYLGSHGAAFALAFAAGACACVAIAALTRAPSLSRVAGAERTARALAASRYDARMELGDDALSDLARALNDAAAATEAIVASLRHERVQLEALLNASSDATLAVDGDGTVRYMNDAARSIFGARGGRGRPFIEVVRDHDLNDVVIAAARRGERTVRVVPYGTAQRWLQATAVPIAGGSEWAALAVFHDLTEVRRLDSMRRDFISNVSHELRTPLAGIRASAETLQDGALDDPAAAREFLAHIERETDRLTQMVEELLELSRIESGAAPMHLRSVDAGVVIAEAASRFAQQADRAGVSLTVEKPGERLPIEVDPERLERAIGNLVANALRFTPAGGSVTLSAAPSDGGTVAISVADTGVGIEPEERGRVFERFYKSDHGRGSDGVGLGLAIVKHIVLAHEGTVSVDSRVGRGSTFTIRLPRR